MRGCEECFNILQGLKLMGYETIRMRLALKKNFNSEDWGEYRRGPELKKKERNRSQYL